LDSLCDKFRIWQRNFPAPPESQFLIDSSFRFFALQGLRFSLILFPGVWGNLSWMLSMISRRMLPINASPALSGVLPSLCRPVKLTASIKVTLFLVLFLVASGFVAVPPGTEKTVLVLYGERGDLPAIGAVEESVRRFFHSSASPRIELFSEYLDFARFPEEQYGRSLARYLQDRYRGRRIDLVVPVAGSALEFALGHREELFPGVPLVFCAVDQRELEKMRLPADATGVTAHFDIERTVKLILQLQPNVREIVCVSGTSGFDQRWAEETRKIMERFQPQVRTRWIAGESLTETADETSRIAGESAVLFISMLRDGTGRSTSSVDVVRDLVRASKAPIYGMSSQFLEAGVVGGAMFDFGLNARNSAELALKILRGQWVPYGAPETESRNPVLVNWQALKKAGLPEWRVPADAQVRQKHFGLWETHRALILAVAGAIILEVVLISGLVLERLSRRKAEALLRQSEERMSLAAEAASLGLWEWEVGRNDVWMTDGGRALLGFTPDERLDYEALTARVHPEDRSARDAAIRGALKTRGEYATEYRVMLPDGRLRWIDARGHCMNGGGKGTRFLGVSMDATARKQAHDALLESEARFRTMADSAPVMIWMSGTDKLCIFFNKGWLDFTGRLLEQELGNGWAEGVHREDLDGCLEVYVNSFDARCPFTMEYRLRRSDGEYRWVLDSGAPRFAPDGTFLGYIGSCIDITEYKQAQDRFRLVVEASPNGIVLVDAQGRIMLVNARAEKLFGYGREELVGQSVELLVPKRFRGEHLALRAGFYAAPAARAIGAGRELFAQRKDGTEFPVEIGISPIQSTEGTLVLSAIVDITERKQAESDARKNREELAHLSRVAIMGEMAGSLAHELNQPLTGILNNASAGRRFIAKGRAGLPKLDALFEAVVEDGRRASEIIRGIRSMVHKDKQVRCPLNLNDVITAVLRFVHSDALERHCVLVTECEPELPLVEGDQVQLQQVLLNLIVNAFEAMSETPLAERRVIVRTERESDGRVRVSVRDFGTGLPPGNPERIFEHFFSTKRGGLGMGLAIVRSIIASHEGELVAVNAEDRGTCVYFSLPVIAEGNA
jgi:two-component system, LuxR family, sensor kinase FixL